MYLLTVRSRWLTLIMMENHVGVSSHSQKAGSSSPVPWVASSDRLRASLGRLHTRNTSTVIRVGQSELHTEYCYKNWPERSLNYAQLGYPERCHNHCFTFICYCLHYFFLCRLPFKKIIILIIFDCIIFNEVVFQFQKF